MKGLVVGADGKPAPQYLYNEAVGKITGLGFFLRDDDKGIGRYHFDPS